MVKNSKTAKTTVSSSKIKLAKKIPKSDIPATMKIAGERDIAYDFALKVNKFFDKFIKSVVLFGSSAKGSSKSSSDIDIVIIIDDVSIIWDAELIAWYREELAKLLQLNPYVKPLHINSVKLSTWWRDLMKGDPVVLNVIRFGDALIDYGGFFGPLKILLKNGEIKSTPEAIYTLLQRSPAHLARSRQAILSAVDGFYWTMLDSAHAVMIASDITPASPEEISRVLMDNFVRSGKLNKKYVEYYDEVHAVAKDISHGKVAHVKGKIIDEWLENSESFLNEMAGLVKEIIEEKSKKGM